MSDTGSIFEARLIDRKTRLRQELEGEQVVILGDEALPDGAAAELGGALDALILEEVVYSRHVPVHEGLRPSYGCLAVMDCSDVAESLETFTLAEPTEPARDPVEIKTEGDETTGAGGVEVIRTTVDLHAIRPLVDGQSTVLVRDISGVVGLASLDLSDELGAVDASRTHHAVTVQRLPNGRVRVVTRRLIAVNDGHDWSVRPHAGTVVRSLTGELVLPDNRLARMREIGSLLEFCFHSLSPAGIGATLVVSLAGSATDLESGVSDRGTRPAVALNVFERGDQVLLRNVLAAVDGACLIDPDGSLRRYQTKLTSSEETQTLIAEHGGTRHTSAKRFTFEHPNALAIVVSADGPVTLFCAGAVVASLPVSARVGTWVLEATAEMRGRIKSTDREDECAQCHTRLITRATTDPEDETPRNIECVVCGNPVTALNGVVEMSTRVKRPWE